MPGFVPVVGQEFPWASVSNGDGGTLSIWVTVVNQQRDFSVRVEQTGPSGGVLVWQNDNGTERRRFAIEPGSRVLVSAQESRTFNASWEVWEGRLSLLGASA